MGKRLALIALSIVCFSGRAEASETGSKPPFAWPHAYVASVERECEGRVLLMTYMVDGNKMRTDTKDGNVSYSIIYNGAKKRTINILDGRIHIYPFGGASKQDAPPMPPPPFPITGAWEALGQHTVDGKSATKYRETLPMPSGQSRSFYVWLSKDGKTPVRAEDSDSVMKFTSYKIGHQNPELFELPKE